jgi:hypothetical protein
MVIELLQTSHKISTDKLHKDLLLDVELRKLRFPLGNEAKPVAIAKKIDSKLQITRITSTDIPG